MTADPSRAPVATAGPDEDPRAPRPSPVPLSPPALEARAITRRCPNALANDAVDFVLRQGEVHALLGENGAGKSTLMNILYGMFPPDAGEIWRSGKRVTLRSPSDAIALGIGMVHQHFMLIPGFTVAENVLLGAEITGRFGTLDPQIGRAHV